MPQLAWPVVFLMPFQFFYILTYLITFSVESCLFLGLTEHDTSIRDRSLFEGRVGGGGTITW